MSRNSPHFMEPEGSLQHLQQPATCPYPELINSVRALTSHFLKIHFSVILGLPSSFFPSGLPTKSMYAPLLSPIRSACPANLIFDFITRTILGEQYRSLSSSLCSFLHSPLRPKYSPQHPILKHPQPTFLTHCQRPSFTPI